jgi:hypothetical protein
MFVMKMDYLLKIVTFFMIESYILNTTHLEDESAPAAVDSAG